MYFHSENYNDQKQNSLYEHICTQLAERKKAGLGIEASNSHATFGHNPMRFAWGFDEETDECREAMRPYAHCRFRMI